MCHCCGAIGGRSSITVRYKCENCGEPSIGGVWIESRPSDVRPCCGDRVCINAIELKLEAERAAKLKS